MEKRKRAPRERSEAESLKSESFLIVVAKSSSSSETTRFVHCTPQVRDVIGYFRRHDHPDLTSVGSASPLRVNYFTKPGLSVGADGPAVGESRERLKRTPQSGPSRAHG